MQETLLWLHSAPSAAWTRLVALHGSYPGRFTPEELSTTRPAPKGGGLMPNQGYCCPTVELIWNFPLADEYVPETIPLHVWRGLES